MQFTLQSCFSWKQQNTTQSLKGFYLFIWPKSLWLDSRLRCHWLSCQIVLSDIGFILWTALLRMKKDGQQYLGTMWSLSSGPGGREPGRGALFALGVICPLLSPCCVCNAEKILWIVKSCSSQRTSGRTGHLDK